MSVDLNSLISKGIHAIWENDRKSQNNFCNIIFEARKMRPFDAEKYGMVFLPNSNYLALYCGDEIRDPAFGCYDFDGNCVWSNFLLVPIFNVAGQVVGLGGFNPFNYLEAHEKNDWSIIYYQYSTKQVFAKGNYLYYAGDSFERSMSDGYLCLVDGLFDAVSLKEAGFNAAALMSSSVTKENLVLMRFPDRLILIPDNDDAGIKLEKELQRKVKGMVSYHQKYAKDIDGVLKSEMRSSIVDELSSLIYSDI